jgi:hypothetical protein
MSIAVLESVLFNSLVLSLSQMRSLCLFRCTCILAFCSDSAVPLLWRQATLIPLVLQLLLLKLSCASTCSLMHYCQSTFDKLHRPFWHYDIASLYVRFFSACCAISQRCLTVYLEQWLRIYPRIHCKEDPSHSGRMPSCILWIEEAPSLRSKPPLYYRGRPYLFTGLPSLVMRGLQDPIYNPLKAG